MDAEEAVGGVRRYGCIAARSGTLAVKTLSDTDAAKVNFKPVPATIAQLAALPYPNVYLPDTRRVPPVELTTYVVKARLIEYKRENDDDFHLVIADPADWTKTMIAEIAAPAVRTRRKGCWTLRGGNSSTCSATSRSRGRGPHRRPALT